MLTGKVDPPERTPVTKVANAVPQAYLDPDLLAGVCKEVRFAAGDELRRKGLLSVDMYVITSGEVDISVGGSAGASSPLTAVRGSPIGEIGFITGVPATATVTAKTNVSALYIDKSAWRTMILRRVARHAGAPAHKPSASPDGPVAVHLATE
jgi:CRP-like cAMP-binding protein